MLKKKKGEIIFLIDFYIATWLRQWLGKVELNILGRMYLFARQCMNNKFIASVCTAY